MILNLGLHAVEDGMVPSFCHAPLEKVPPHRWYGNTFIRIDYFVHAHDVLLEVVTAAIKAYIECYSYAFSNECLKTALLKGRKAFPNAPLEAHGFRLKLLSEAVTTLCHAEVGHSTSGIITRRGLRPLSYFFLFFFSPSSLLFFSSLVLFY